MTTVRFIERMRRQKQLISLISVRNVYNLKCTHTHTQIGVFIVLGLFVCQSPSSPVYLFIYLLIYTTVSVVRPYVCVQCIRFTLTMGRHIDSECSISKPSEADSERNRERLGLNLDTFCIFRTLGVKGMYRGFAF